MKIRVFTAFSGYDSQCLALNRLKEQYPNFDYELVGWSEIEPNAIKAHNALFPEYQDRNFGDIRNIDWSKVPDFDLFTYSSPCQDFSNAGKRQGGIKGSGTRSSLLWECERAIKAKKPKYLLLENVAALVNKQFLNVFNDWQILLTNYGYQSFSKVLNAKDFSIPQNRERVFCISVRGGTFYFPKGKMLSSCVNDLMESATEKYFLNDKKLQSIYDLNATKHQGKRKWLYQPMTPEQLQSEEDKMLKALTHKEDTRFLIVPQVLQVGQLLAESNFKNPNRGRVYSTRGLSPTLNTSCGGMVEAKFILNSRIRVITPRECYRLMGLRDSEIDKILDVIKAKTPNYHLSGNSIVVNVLERIFYKMFIKPQNEEKQLQIEFI